MTRQDKFIIQQNISREDLKAVLTKSDGQGLWMLSWNWLLIVGSLVLAGIMPNLITILLALVILGGRQLGLVILMHDCAHYSLFKSKSLNHWLGEYLCAAPLLARLDGYRHYHLLHHQNAGTDTDPDLPNYAHFPISRASLKRKIIRDLTGRTGIKNLKVILAMSLGVYEYTLAFRKSEKKAVFNWSTMVQAGVRNSAAPVLVNFLMWLSLYLLGIGWAYLLWVVSYLTTYQLFLRIRNIAEHAAVLDPYSSDPRFHTRTTLARWWERLTVAPNFVNYHLEHHLLPAAPSYRLADLHELMTEKKLLPARNVCRGYGEAIGQLVTSEPLIQVI